MIAQLVHTSAKELAKPAQLYVRIVKVHQLLVLLVMVSIWWMENVKINAHHL
jgi:hypothetical protein